MFYIILIFTVFFSSKLISNNIFESDEYEVNFISDNVDKLKLEKLREIKKTSLNSIFNNILNKENYIIQKRNLNEDFINTFIKSINFKNEKIINNNYHAKIKINFDKKLIINYLREENIPYVEYHPQKLLIIINENKEITNYLFSKKNLHYNFLLNNKKLFNNFYFIPNLDVNDRYLLNINDIKNNKFEKINNFKKKYFDIDTIFIFSNEIDGNIFYEIFFYNDNKFNLIKKFKYNNYQYQKLFYELKPIILEKWKNLNQIQNIKINKINCEISYFNFLELKEIRKKITNNSIIKKINLKSFSLKYNLYDIYYFGDKNILFELFERNNLIVNYNNEICKIKLK